MNVVVKFQLLLLFSSMTALAQEPVDSLAGSTELDAFVVEAKNQRVSAGETVSVPTAQQKQISAGGYDLLKHLSLTQILVKPSEEKVSTLTGADVAIFINGIKVQGFEVSGINTADVLKVEYLEYPTDSRFGGEKYVLNFVLKTYNNGGYVRLGENAKFIQSTENSSDIYVKNNYKKLSYDFYINYKYHNSHHEVSNTYESFSLLNAQSEPYLLTKQSNADYSRKRGWELPLSFMATYTDDKVSISNYAGFSHYATPINIQKGVVSISGGTEEEYGYQSKTTDNNNAWWWSGQYNFNLSKGLYLFLLPNVSGIEYKHSQSYESQASGVENIENNSTDNFTHYLFLANLTKEITACHTVNFEGLWAHNGHDIKYSSTSQYRNKEFENFLEFNATYKFSIPSVLMLNTKLGLLFLSLGNDENKVSGVYPNVDIYCSYTPTPAHQLNLTVQHFHQMTLPHFFNSNTIRLSEYMYATGNPDTKEYNNFHANLTYTWIHSNRLNITALTSYNYIKNYACELYRHYDGGAALLRYPQMGVSNNMFQTGASVRYNPMEKLQLSALGVYFHQEINCDMRPHINQFFGSLSATYYFGKMYAGVEVGTPVTYFEYEQTKYKHPMTYGLNAGYGNGAWNVKLNTDNIFRRSWTPGTTELITPLYTSISHISDRVGNRYVGISVSYIFDYGKKVEHGNEISASGAGQSSAILK